MKLIAVIDDAMFHRRLAGFELGRSGVIIPNSPTEIDTLPTDNIGLIVLDRHLLRDWREATERLLHRLPPDTEVIEWTASTKFDTRDRWLQAVLTIAKSDTTNTLAKAVGRWRKTGTVLEQTEAIV